MKKTARKQWWIIVILTVVAMGILGICVYKVTHPIMPFEFLEGVRADTEDPVGPLGPRRIIPMNGIDYMEVGTIYDLPTDFAIVKAKAEQELLPQGFKPEEVDDFDGVFAVPYARRVVEQDRSSLVDRVTLCKDMRYHRGEYRPGWTRVTVQMWIRPSPIELIVNQCKEWMPTTAKPQIPEPHVVD